MAFLDAYEAVAPLTVEESTALPVIAAWNFAPSACSYRRWLVEGIGLSSLNRDALGVRNAQTDVTGIAPAFGRKVL